MKFTLKEIILIGIFAALTTICAQFSINIPFSPVPITLQIFAVCFSAAILGTKCGTFSQLIYVLLGTFGVPVFNHFSSGLMRPTGGYIISFPIVALVIGLILAHVKNPTKKHMFFAMVVGLIICYSIGTIWLGLYLKLSFYKSLVAGIGWYLPFDILKIVIASIIGFEVRKALQKANLIL
jgi:biotin transport system substrate-specific component